jgi:uncharacterized protein YndB with AHSA1/START domain
MAESKTRILAEPGEQQIVITRQLGAGVGSVFEAHVDSALFARWFGCRGMTTDIDEFVPRRGGRYRFTQSVGGQKVLACRGVFHAVTRPSLIVKTVEFEGQHGGVILETTRFEASSAGKTRITVHSVFQSVSDRDRMLAAGVEKGAGETYARLSELLDEIESTQL